MALEDMPQGYLDQLRALAARHDAPLLPLSRIVLVVIASGDQLPQGSGSAFRPNQPAPPPRAAPARVAVAATASSQPVPDTPLWPQGHVANRPPEPPPPGTAAPPPGFDRPAAPPQGMPPPAPGSGGGVPHPFAAPFSLPEEAPADEAPFGTGASDHPKTGFGWAWEPPELEDPASDR